jgi:hypothetical protein
MTAMIVRIRRSVGTVVGMMSFVIATMACGASASSVPQPPAMSLEEIAFDPQSPTDAGKRD